MMLVDRTEQLHDKETLIKELQNTISQLTNASASPSKSTFEEETQVSFEEQQAELAKRFNEVLNAREQEGVSLHLASKELM